MGSLLSKPPSPRRTRIRDSMVIDDGLPRLCKAMYAGSPGGCYVFILGHLHTPRNVASEAWQDHLNDEQLALTFRLDVVDLFYRERTRINNIGDFYNMGAVSGFYALNENTVVIVDYTTNVQTLRQRLITIDMCKKTAFCHIYRNYEATLFLRYPPKTSAGDEWAVTVVPNRHTVLNRLPYYVTNDYTQVPIQQTGIVYPKNPLSPHKDKSISNLFFEANARLAEVYPGRRQAVQISTLYAPFFISNTKLGCFIDHAGLDEIIDPSKVIVMDLDSGAVRIEKTTGSEAFESPVNVRWSQGNNSQVALIAKCAHGWLWRQLVDATLLPLLIGTLPMCLPAFLAIPFASPDRIMAYMRWLIDKPAELTVLRARWRESSKSRIGILCTKSLKWTEIEANLEKEEEARLISLQGGQFVLASMTTEAGPSRVPNGNYCHSEKLTKGRMERFQLVGNPLKVSALKDISRIAVQRIHRIPREVLDQIAERML